MIKYKEILSYTEIIQREDVSLQRGMNFRIKPQYSIFLMSVRPGAPYNDAWHEDLGLLEYEGHDLPNREGINPKKVDQPMKHRKGSLTDNGKFYTAANAYKENLQKAEIIQVYEKITRGVWSDRGRFELIDAKTIHDGNRNVFRFFLRPTAPSRKGEVKLKHSRVIPTPIKAEVWKRDHGQCVLCGSDQNLHFDHDIPFSKGGSSMTAQNVRLLCAKHNLEKSDKIMSLAPWLVGTAMIIVSRPA